MRTAIVTNMFPDSDAPYLGTFVKDTLKFFGESMVVYPGNSLRGRKAVFYWILYVRAFRAIFWSRRIVFHYPMFFFPLVLLSRCLGRDVILVYHGGEFMNRPWSNALFRKFQYLTMLLNNSCSNTILLPSNFVLKSYFERWRNKAVVWYSGGANTSISRPVGGRREFDFMFIGRDSHEKGFDCFNLALQYLSLQGVACRVAVVLREIHYEHHRSFGLVSVNYFPAKPQQEVGSFIAGARFVVIPSREESLCLLAIEAALSGALVISRSLEPIRETLGEHPIYFEADEDLGHVMEIAVGLVDSDVSSRVVALQHRAVKYSMSEVYERFSIR